MLLIVGTYTHTSPSTVYVYQGNTITLNCSQSGSIFMWTLEASGTTRTISKDGTISNADHKYKVRIELLT